MSFNNRQRLKLKQSFSFQLKVSDWFTRGKYSLLFSFGRTLHTNVCHCPKSPIGLESTVKRFEPWVESTHKKLRILEYDTNPDQWIIPLVRQAGRIIPSTFHSIFNPWVLTAIFESWSPSLCSRTPSLETPLLDQQDEVIISKGIK